jgi:L-ascorbate metabolism protein UlaG (beta-lactamase superfamily)
VKKPTLTAALLLLGAIMPLPAARAESVENGPVVVTYIANEGFLVERGEKKVLIDALFPGIRHYPTPSREVATALERGEAPFDGIDLALASHYHRDHFGPDEVRRFLLGNPRAVFLAAPQAVARVEAGGMDDRLHAVFPPEGESRTTTIAGIGVTVFNLHHGQPKGEIQNLGLLIDLDGFRILHIGDTEISAGEIRPLRLDQREIDLALLPCWYLTEPTFSGVVAEIRPANIAAMHLADEGAPSSWFGSARSRSERIAQIRRGYPQAWAPTESLQKRSFSAASR